MIVPLAAYFDASGTRPEQPVWAIGGWIAEIIQWERFCQNWQSMLDRAPFRSSVPKEKRMFHAADLESQVDIYQGWSKQQQQTFQGEAYEIVSSLQLFPISSAVIKKDYDELKYRFPRFPIGHQGNYYQYAFHDVLTTVRKWLEAQRFEASVHYVFEAGDIKEKEIQNQLQEIYDNAELRDHFRMTGWTMTGKQLLPLQAADLWSYEIYKQMINRVVGDKRIGVRYPFQKLYRQTYQRYQAYWDREAMMSFIETYEKEDAMRKGQSSLVDRDSTK